MSLAPLRSAASCGARRTFSTTPRPLRISPESPQYIEVPRPPTIRAAPRPRQKGKLPHPKSIPYKLSPGPATKEPAPRGPPIGVDADTAAYISWKDRLAESRRRNLREGVAELHTRQKTHEARRAMVLKKRTEDREALLAAKQREDVRLTLPTVLSTLRSDDGSAMERISEERLAQKRVTWEAVQARKSAERIECFHELYLNAREFIVTEKQLDEAIENEFQPTDHLYKALPQTVEDMLLQVQNNRAQFGRDPKMMEIAGRLTGAKLVPEKRAREMNGHGLDEEGGGLISRNFGRSQ